MERFHFNLSNGSDFLDEEGAECETLDAARAQALQVMAETLTSDAAGFWSTGHLEVTVTDSRGLTLFCIRTVAQDAAAAPARKR